MAPKDRVTPDSLTYERQGDSTILRPQANPVNTFVKPTEPLKSTLVDVAQALAQVQPKLERYATEKAHEEAVNDIRTAEATAMASSAATWDEAIQKGEVPAGASPLYQRVFEETKGKSNGLTEAQAAVWQKWVSPDNAIRTTQDPKVISEWFAERRKELVDGKNPDWVKGFMPAFNQVQQQLTQKIIGDNVKYIEQANHDALGQLFTGRILEGVASGKSHAQIAAQLADDSLPQRFAGLQGREINRIAASAIISAAQKTGRTDLLQVGYQDRPDLKNPGGTIKGVFTIPEFAMQADSVATSILSKQNALATRAQIAEAKAEKTAMKGLYPDILEARRKDPDGATPPDELLDKYSKMGVPLTVIMGNWSAVNKAMPSMSYADRIMKMSDLAKVVNTGGDAAAWLVHNPGVVTDSQAFSMITGGGLRDAQNSDIYRTQQRGIDGMIDAFTKRFEPTVGSERITRARGELEGRVADLFTSLAASGSVDPKKLSDGIRDIGADILSRMSRDAAQPATPPPPAQSTNKPAPTQQAPTQQAPTQQTPAPAKSGANAPSAPAAPVAAAIPTDAIIPVTQANQIGGLLPEVPGGGVWAPKTWDGLDMKTINHLRSAPNRDVQGRPLWQHLDERYGEGASRWLLTATAGEIKLMFKKQQFHNTPVAPLTTTLDEVVDALTRPRNQPNK